MSRQFKEYDDKATAFMFSEFPDSKKRHGSDRYLATCPHCRKKLKYWWHDKMPHHGGCFSCAASHKSVFDLGYRTEFQPGDRQDLTPLENLVYRYRKDSGKTHRLSDRVIAEFGLFVAEIAKTDGTGNYTNIALPSKNKLGFSKHLNFSGRWVSVSAKNRDPEEKWSNLNRISNDSESPIYVLAGEWDMFSFWEHTGIHGISPLDGEGTPAKFTREQLEIFSNRHVIIFFDNDKQGYKGARALAKRIQKFHKVKSIKIVDLHRLGLTGGQDVDDFFSSGGDKKRLFEEVEKSPDFAGGIFDANPELSRSKTDDPMPRHPDSVLDEDTLKKLWSMVTLPAAKRDMLFNELSEAQGIFRNQPAEWRKEINKYDQELKTLRYLAFDLEVEKTFKRFHVKQLKKTSDFDSPKFFFYADGYYQFLTDTEISIWSDEIARRITPQDDRTMLSKIRKQAGEDLRIKMNEAEFVDFYTNSVDYINFENGAYHLKSSILMNHSPGHYLTYKLPIKYMPEASCPNFERALKMSFKSQADQNEMLKGLYYLISGIRSKDKLFWFYGRGNDGKTEFSLLAKSLIGESRTSAVPLESMSGTHGTAPLFNKLLNIADEVDRDAKIPAGLLKRLTGGSYMGADPKWHDQISFINRALVMILSNDLPRSSDTSHGYNRRFKIFKFQRINAKDQIDDFFETRLKPELDGIAYKLLTVGRELFEKEGFRDTDSSIEAMEEMQAKNSVLNYWMGVYSHAVIKSDEIISKTKNELIRENFSEDDAKKEAVARWNKEWMASPNAVDDIQDYTIVQKYHHKKRGEILIINTDKHYQLYRESIKGDEVMPVSYANFRKSTSDYLAEKSKKIYTEPTTIEIWKTPARDPLSTKYKNIQLLQVRRIEDESI